MDPLFAFGVMKKVVTFLPYPLSIFPLNVTEGGSRELIIKGRALNGGSTSTAIFVDKTEPFFCSSDVFFFFLFA
jgi:hypothetical protein